MSSRRNNLKDIPFQKNAHTGLWLDKYIKDHVADKIKGELKDQKADKVKAQLVEEVASISETPIYKAFYERWEKMMSDYCAVPPREAEVQGRMVIGMGDESVLETSVTLHYTYGVPYIPGSALKGLAANYVRQKLGVEWKKEGEAYKTIFGETDEAGYITFFDAYYIPGSGYQGKALYPDIITVHHQDYYQEGKKAPADWDSPIPVPFLSATGRYLIALAAPELQQPTEWINTTFTILRDALKTLGIGAKTSSGYGRLKLKANDGETPPANTESVQPKSVEHIRPKIPQFREGQEITGSVVASTDDLRRLAPPDVRAFLRYQSFAIKDVVIVVSTEEAQNWKPGETRICLFVREEVQDGCTVLICQPRPSKKKKG